MDIKKAFAAAAITGLALWGVSSANIWPLEEVKAAQVQETAKVEEFVIQDGNLIAYNGEKEKVTVPEGVTCIKSKAFPANVEVLILPDSLEEIETYAIASAERIQFGWGLKKIADKAIGYKMLSNYIMRPDGSDYDMEFEWAYDIKMYGPVNSISEDYAKRNGFTYNDEMICLMDDKILHTTVQGKKNLMLYWDSQYLADGYYIYRSEKEDGPYQQIAAVKQYKAPENFYTIQDCEPGKEYFYQVKSFRNDTKNDTILVSDRAIQTSAATKIGVREIYVSSSDSSSLEIGWHKNSYDTEVGGYYLWRADSQNGTYKKIATIKNVTGKKAVTKYLDKNLKLGKTYYYKINAFDPKIKAFDGPLSKAYSQTVTMKDMGFSYLSAKRKNGTKVLLTWKKNSDADGYVLYRKLDNVHNKYVRIATINNKNSLSYTDPKIAEQERYRYCVKGYKKANGKTYYSNTSVALVEKLVPIQSVYPIYADRTEEAIKVSWSRTSDDVDGYLLYRREDIAGGEYVRVAKFINKGESSYGYIDKDVKTETSYRYYVKTYKKYNGKTYYSTDGMSGKSVGPFQK